MSNIVWTPPKYLAWSVFKSPQHNTLIQEATSGKTTRSRLWANPKWNYKLTWELLKGADGPPSSLNQLLDFFNARGGGYDTFWYSDPTDNSVLGQLLGYGDGILTQFQLVRALGGNFYESIQNLNALTALYSNGQSLAALSNIAPVAPVCGLYAVAGAGAGAGFFKCTWALTSGESAASAETNDPNITPGFLCFVTRPANPPPDAVGWYVYGSATTGNEVLQTPTYLPISQTQWFMPAVAFVSGRLQPQVTNFQIGMENILLQSQTFTVTPWQTNSITLTANATTAPDGSGTATKEARNAAPSNFIFQQVNLAANGIAAGAGEVLTASAYMMQGTTGVQGQLILIFLDANGVEIIRTTGAANSLTSAWNRFAVSATVPIGAVTVQTTINITNTTTNGDFIYIWGSQLERGSIPSGYLATTTAFVAPLGVITFASAIAAQAALTADFSFYRRLRFVKDINEFEEFMFNLWNLKMLELISERS